MSPGNSHSGGEGVARRARRREVLAVVPSCGEKAKGESDGVCGYCPAIRSEPTASNPHSNDSRGV